ncbi:cysteine desulfurase family protein [Chryseobacterium culicis]|uniref:cysteine desulfurase n=1 Tax=Chryseobacterium culicis TaxID=680127 RepID=A0A1H6IN52_CHRCI|nr:cysteine desulfurase family protein [Chryseobacterium culicis]SEH47686.1 cysteine desulfurase [Chryseobacterium culicis]
MENDFVYLDFNATTPVDPRVIDEMSPYFNNFYANSGSSHLFGIAINESVENARKQIADLITANIKEIIYTSGATEAVNLALKGFDETNKKHIITVKTEHKAVLDTCSFLENRGFNMSYLDVDREGHIDLDELRNELNEKTLMVCVMYVNNETGIIHPIKEIADITRQNGSLFFCDATQAIGKIPIAVKELDIDLMAFSAHKFYGPKGIGALYISSRLKKELNSQIQGGGQQFNLRSGTLNVPGIIAMGKAAEIAMLEMQENRIHIAKLRDELENALLEIPEVYINGDKNNRIFNTTNICFKGVNSEQMILSLGTVCVSSGSACNATTSKPSHVLKAMGINDSDALSSIRFSLGKFNTRSDIEIAVEKIKKIVAKLREV